jgi:PAS domain S-box-containing protein
MTKAGRWYEVFAYQPAARQFAVGFTDISGRKRTEESLRQVLTRAEEGDRMLSALMEYVPEGITMADKALNLVRVSRYGMEMIGGPHEGMSTEDVAAQWKVCHANGNTPMAFEELPLMRAVQRGEVVKDAEVVQVNARGEGLPLLCTAGPIRDATGNVIGGIAAWRDITERKQMEAELRRSRDELELRVQERTAELEKANAELGRYNRQLEGAALAAASLNRPLGVIAVHRLRSYSHNSARFSCRWLPPSSEPISAPMPTGWE